MSTKKTFKQICDLIVEKKAKYPTIYVGSYYMRDLIAGYEIFGNQQYLKTAISYGDYLLRKQLPNGLWGTGYGAVYLADTGTALQLLMALYKYVSPTRQKKYFNAIKDYVTTILNKNMRNSNGSFGVGWLELKDGKVSNPVHDQYTLGSALTGTIVFTWMYTKTHKNKYREIAYKALRWIFSTMRSDGTIPYIYARVGSDWSDRGDPATDFNLWVEMTYGTAAYVGEAVIFFYQYCDNPSWKRWIEKTVKPNIEFLLRTQRPDGTWSKRGRKSWDRTRNPGIINYLIWYYKCVDQDPRIVEAVRRFDEYIVDPENGKYYGLIVDGADTNNGDFNSATSIVGKALAAILYPGIMARW